MRRYHHSCDQCRKSKRACDAPKLTLPDHANGSVASLLGGNLEAPKLRPCSYCSRTMKSCTVDWAWSQLRVTAALEAASRGELGVETLAPSKRAILDDSGSQVQVDSAVAESSPEPFSFESPAVVEDPLLPSYSSHFDTLSPPSQLPVPFPFGFFNANSFGAPPEYINKACLGFDLPVPEPINEIFPYDLLDLTTIEESPSQLHSSSGHYFNMPGATDAQDAQYTRSSMAQGYTFSSTQSGISESEADGPVPKRRRHTHPCESSSLSPFSATSAMISRTNNTSISSNLLQIYHDVLEHNLSCWLTEVSCPYKGARGKEEGRRLAEWGPSWSNRIFHRTVKLDHAARSSGLIHLNRSEEKAANRALHYSIMAFATQWAQGSRRYRERYTFLGNAFESDFNRSFDELTEGFDRNLQWHFWSQAQRALQEVEHVECYKVACAEMVFGLAQKPWEQEDVQPSCYNSGPPVAPFDPATLTTEVSRAIIRDGPPIHIERAVRKMHTLKFRFDTASKRVSMAQNNSQGLTPMPSLSPEDETTVGLLYWLAVMFDTVSSSMNERPVTVTDQECQHDGVPPNEADHGRWAVDLFIKDSLDEPSLGLHWPCTYEDAAEAVTQSGPVKVLLYRHVSYLQNLIRRGQTGERVEEIIQSTTSLYRYWNITYSAFFRELVQDFDAVPSRIRSWFFCISAHWHLAVLMLADLIECIDGVGMGLPAAGHRRTSTKMVTAMRESSVHELSDLARVSIPPDVTEPQLPDFHHVVNEGIVLTEPWTIILIRAFSRATVLILQETDNYRRYGLAASRSTSDEIRNSLERAEDCIKTLFYLGKKSDMARRVADILSTAQVSLRLNAFKEDFNE